MDSSIQTQTLVLHSVCTYSHTDAVFTTSSVAKVGVFVTLDLYLRSVGFPGLFIDWFEIWKLRHWSPKNTF